MDNKAFYIGNICKKREYFEIVDEFPCFLLTAFYFKGEDRCSTVGEICFIECMVGMVWERWMVDFFYLRIVGEIFNDFFGILSKRKALNGEMDAPVSRRRIARI